MGLKLLGKVRKVVPDAVSIFATASAMWLVLLMYILVMGKTYGHMVGVSVKPWVK